MLDAEIEKFFSENFGKLLTKGECMRNIKKYLYLFFIFFFLLNCQKKIFNNKLNIKTINKDITNNENLEFIYHQQKAVFKDLFGQTRFDPLKIKVGDKINKWKVVNVKIDKIEYNSTIDILYQHVEKKFRKNYSAEVEFEGKVETWGIYHFSSWHYPLEPSICLSMTDTSLFPLLNYDNGRFFDLKINIDNTDDKICGILSNNQGFIPDLKGDAIFTINKFKIYSAYDENAVNMYYGIINVLNAEEIIIEK